MKSLDRQGFWHGYMDGLTHNYERLMRIYGRIDAQLGRIEGDNFISPCLDPYQYCRFQFEYLICLVSSPAAFAGLPPTKEG